MAKIYDPKINKSELFLTMEKSAYPGEVEIVSVDQNGCRLKCLLIISEMGITLCQNAHNANIKTSPAQDNKVVLL